jgi:hypothetical protein
MVAETGLQWQDDGEPVLLQVSIMYKVPAVLLVLLLSLYPCALRAQTTNASITGRVTDPSKATVPEAKVAASNGTVRLLESRTGVLGCLVETAQPAAAEEVELAPGDRVVFYTDGLIEVFNRSGDMLGVEGLEKIVRQSAMRALPEMKQAILGWPRRLETRHYGR